MPQAVPAEPGEQTFLNAQKSLNSAPWPQETRSPGSVSECSIQPRPAGPCGAGSAACREPARLPRGAAHGSQLIAGDEAARRATG